MWWVSALIDLRKSFPSLAVIGSTVVQNIIYFLLLYSRYVSGGFSLVDFSPSLLIFRCKIVVFVDFKDTSWWASLWVLDKSSGNLVWLPWVGLLLLGWKVRHEDTVSVLAWLSGPEFYLSQLMIVVYPGELPTLKFACSCCLLLFLVNIFGVIFISFLVWWCIHNHIRLPMVLVRLFSILEKY